MKKLVSSGGVVYFNNSILLLRKINGDWVLPKGGVEVGETLEEAGLREVKEEAGVKADIVEYIGEIQYTMRSSWNSHKRMSKKVHWYLMKARNMDCVPQKSEGFIEAKFVHINNGEKMLRYSEERKMVNKAVKRIKEIINYEEA